MDHKDVKKVDLKLEHGAYMKKMDIIWIGVTSLSKTHLFTKDISSLLSKFYESSLSGVNLSELLRLCPAAEADAQQERGSNPETQGNFFRKG